MNTIFISALSSVTELSHLAVVYNRYCVGITGLLHLGHLLPLSGGGVEHQDVIKEGSVIITA